MKHLKKIEDSILTVAKLLEEHAIAVFNEWPQSQVGIEKAFWGNQLFFLSKYLILQQIDTLIPQYNQIKKILKLQTTNRCKGVFRINFLQGAPFDVFLKMKTPKDIDFADVYLATGFEVISIQPGTEELTQKMIAGFVKQIKEDMAFDGYKVSAETSFEKSSADICVTVSGGEATLFRNVKAARYGEELLHVLAQSKKHTVRALIAETDFINKRIARLLADDDNVNVLLNLIFNVAALRFLSKRKLREIGAKISKKIKFAKLERPYFLISKFCDMTTMQHSRDYCSEEEQEAIHNLLKIMGSTCYLPMVKKMQSTWKKVRWEYEYSGCHDLQEWLEGMIEAFDVS